MFKKTLLLLSLSIWTILIHSQTITRSVLSSGGEFGASSSYSVSYTIGEQCIQTLYLLNNIVTEGFQQGAYQKEVTGISGIDIAPNPVRTNLHVYFYTIGETSFLIRLYNLTGSLMYSIQYDNIMNGDDKTIEFSNYSQGLYLLRINSTTGKSLIFKVLKI